jgi:hypothetical protein
MLCVVGTRGVRTFNEDCASWFEAGAIYDGIIGSGAGVTSALVFEIETEAGDLNLREKLRPALGEAGRREPGLGRGGVDSLWCCRLSSAIVGYRPTSPC